MLWISLFRNKIKRIMNVKHVFVFTLCVVLTNGLGSNYLFSTAKRPLSNLQFIPASHSYAQRYYTMGKNVSPVQVDDRQNILIKVYVERAKTKAELYAGKDRIGLMIKAESEQQVNNKLLGYLSFILQIPKIGLKIISGSTSARKTVLMAGGFMDRESVITLLLEEISKHEYSRRKWHKGTFTG